MARVYVSSTYLDLQEHRRQVSLVLRRMGHEDVAMDYYTAEDRPAVDKCLADVATCDIYVGIFAWRYGWIPKQNNPEGLAITEMEYRQAMKDGKVCLVFLLDGKARWPLDFVDDDRTRIKKLRDELSERHGNAVFDSPDNLASQVGAAIYCWVKDQGLEPSAGPAATIALDAYYRVLRKYYRRLDLDALTPPQMQEYLQLELQSIFIEQSVHENPLQKEADTHLKSGDAVAKTIGALAAGYEKPALPVLDVLTNPNQPYNVILGDPGSGKSTLARYVLLSLIDPEGDMNLRRAFDGYLPLLIELKHYAGLYAEGKCDTFLQFLDYLGKTEGWRLTEDALKHYLDHNGRAVIIFDGLDEIFDLKLRDQTARRIVGFASDYPRVHIMVTSRIIGYRAKILSNADFKHFTLHDLDEGQVATFVERWYALALKDHPREALERRERIMTSFKESQSIRQLASNPMLLTIMAIIGKNRDLPRERWKLYEHAVSVLIQHWDVNKYLLARQLNVDVMEEEDKKELLRRLAYQMQSGAAKRAGNYIHEEKLRAEFEAYMKERYNQSPGQSAKVARALIEQLHERNFILSLYGANLYGFVHRAFLEYFCAMDCVHKFEKTQALTLKQLKHDIFGAHGEDQSWHEVLRLICGLIDEKFAGAIVDYLTTEINQSWSREFTESPPWHVSLAVQCLGEIRNLNSAAESARRLLKVICALFDDIQSSSLEQSSEIAFEKKRFIEKQVIRYVKVIGTSWPQRAELAQWIRGRQSYDNARHYAEPFGDFVSSIGKGVEEIHEAIMDYAV
ncbi:MAG: DUF4062 domain-containing protein, partial [Armatimonadota bacterium]|nr:DUF4062 domain-containing protein [Armatimonadota bacterium]